MALLAVETLVGGCALLGWPFHDVATVRDADESYAVLRHVRASGVVPESASAARSQTASNRFLHVVGVEDAETQDRILAAAVEARHQCSTRPVVVLFKAGTVVKDRFGGARYPDGTREIRRETIP